MATGRKGRRVVFTADKHCGHRAGLTPPDWWQPTRGRFAKWGKIQRELWHEYERLIEEVGPVDLVVDVGDLIDGRGEKSGSTELITADRMSQCEMAIATLEAWKSPMYIIVRGTPYHTGELEDFEDEIAKAVNGQIADHAFLDVEGVIIDVKHSVGRSSVPHGRGTALAREWLWNVLAAEREEQPRADVIVRAHVHYHIAIAGADWMAMILPGLQAAATKLGRRMSGTVDWGIVTLDAKEGKYTWESHIVKLKANQHRTIKL